MRRKRGVFNKAKSAALLKAVEEERAIHRGWSVGNIASVAILWDVHRFAPEGIERLRDDVKLLCDDYNNRESDEERQNLVYDRVDIIKDALGINTLWWFEPELRKPEMVGIATSLEMVICSLHDDDYFGVDDEELMTYYEELKEKVHEYALGKWNLKREKDRLEKETGVSFEMKQED